ncbi:MAG: hypothetical protein AAF676_02735, partial [Pseudomonadota bacterium]
MPTDFGGGSTAVAEDPSRIAAAARDSARIAAAVAARPRGVRRVDEAALPLVHASPEGRALLTAPGAGALVLGRPRAQCPARAAGAGADPEAAAREAFAAC